ncbi:MAG: lipopolysaccharide biosynthesis protein RfbH, partial [Cyanobium sp.]
MTAQPEHRLAEASDLRDEILRLTRRYTALLHPRHFPVEHSAGEEWDEGVIPYAARVFAEEEVEAAVASSLDFWLTLGPEGAAFELELAAFLGVRSSLL